MKYCPRCQVTKPLDQFYHHKSGKNAGKPQYSCKLCTKDQQTQWTQANRHQKCVNNLNWRLRNRVRVKLIRDAGNKLHDALRRGLITKASKCLFCQSGDNIEAAHIDYSKPLSVLWLCRPCHRQWDSDSPKSGVTEPALELLEPTLGL